MKIIEGYSDVDFVWSKKVDKESSTLITYYQTNKDLLVL